MSFLLLTALFCSFAVVLSKPQDPSSPTSSSTGPQSTICGDIIEGVNQGQFVFDASDAYDCLTSVPFNAAVASNLIQYYNTTLQFQSTLAYLSNPPQGYQQPAVDVLNQLELIQQNVTAGYYQNEYAFEADLQLLVYSMHDTHVALTAGALAAFSFSSPLSITSASVDGKQPPQIFFTDDIIASQQEGWQPSPVTSINGQAAVDYLTQFAALNSAGTLEPSAQWNQLMDVPALDIQGFSPVFYGAATFYPGEELNFTLANGTEVPTYWLAIYNNPDPTGPLETGGDFYNYFVLGLLPASYDSSSIPDDSEDDDDTSVGSTSLTSFFNASSGAYPSNPDITQPDLSVEGGGVLTGYFLHDVSVAVLSVPTFEQSGDDIGNFSQIVADFIDGAKQAGLSKVVIDLQQNTGGTDELVFDMFHQFFPTMEPFAGSRRRSHELANILGSATTGYFDQSHDETVSADEWVVTDRLNAETGQNFTSWEEYFGPRTYQADHFSLTERYNLSSVVFDEWAFDGWIPYGYTDPVTTEQPWNADDIVLLTDGLCASACSLFLEMMVHEAGARTIVVGGRPETGPMQAAGGTRGARVYSADDVDDDFQFASQVNETANSTLPPRDLTFYVTYAGFNLRDQIRANDSTPLQFSYEAADCRIYYTLANVYNVSQLWRDAAHATWDDTSLCVEGSTGYSTPSNATAASRPPPAPTAQLPSFNSTSVNRIADFNMDATGGLQDGIARAFRDTQIVACGPSGACPVNTVCKSVQVTCGNGSRRPAQACLPGCNSRDGAEGCAGANTYCDLTNTQESKAATRNGASSVAPHANFQGTLRSGFCTPTSDNGKLGCPRV